VPAAWVFTALLASVTHWQFRNRSIAEIQTYITKRELLLAYLPNGPQAATMAELNDTLTHKKEPLPKQFKAQLGVTGFADKLELATMILFAVSMAVTMFEYVIP